MIRSALLLTVLCFSSAPAFAAMRTCETRLNGNPLAITFDDESEVWSSFREGWFTRGSTCPGLVVLQEMTPDLSDTEREVFCAVWDKDRDQYTGFANGARDAYGSCKKRGLLCRAVDATAGEVLAISGLGTRVQDTPAVTEQVEPPTVLGAMADQAGAVIVSGTASYVATTLQSAGTALAATVGGPAALAGAVVSVVAVGGAVYMCGS